VTAEGEPAEPAQEAQPIEPAEATPTEPGLPPPDDGLISTGTAGDDTPLPVALPAADPRLIGDQYRSRDDAEKEAR
jgi:hypothetical protein